MWIMPAAPAAERRSRRRLYFALGGFAIGFGAGIGVLLSSTTRKAQQQEQVTTPDKPKPPETPPKNDVAAKTPPPKVEVKPPETGSGSGSATKTDPPPPPTTTVQAMLQAQRDAIARGDAEAIVAMLAPEAIGFGIDADEVMLDKAAVTAQLKRDLGDLKDGTVEVKFTHIGQEGTHAWIAQELELTSPGKASRKLAITMLAGQGKAGWQIHAWHWAVPVKDEVAEKLAILNTKPSAKPISNKTFADKDLDKAVREAFGSRAGFADARSERDDGFNFGSGPSERIVGGGRVKSIFGKLRAEIKLRDNAAYIVGVTPTIGVALVNADFTHKTRAMTDMTQTFRVLAVLLKEGSAWRLVLTQWSHGGPIRG
jgi:ketosteroid isomerase-like protein